MQAGLLYSSASTAEGFSSVQCADMKIYIVPVEIIQEASGLLFKNVGKRHSAIFCWQQLVSAFNDLFFGTGFLKKASPVASCFTKKL